MRFPYIVLIAAFSFFVTACETQLPPGTVASVNGEYISLHSVQALLDSRSASLGIPARPSVSEMQKNYGHALAILVAHALVRQELASHGIEISESDLQMAIDGIKEDFGEVSLSEYLAEDFLREEDWRQLLRDQLALEAFTDRILLPSIQVTLPEVRAWYEEHQQDFNLPEILDICYASADDPKKLETWCNTEGNSGPGTELFIQCQQTVAEYVSPPWHSGIKKIKPGACASLEEIDGKWRTLKLISKNPARRLPLPEVYALVENIVIEQKKLAAFNAWLENKLANSTIVALPELFAFDESD